MAIANNKFKTLDLAIIVSEENKITFGMDSSEDLTCEEAIELTEILTRSVQSSILAYNEQQKPKHPQLENFKRVIDKLDGGGTVTIEN